jgi:hypothetical protein
MGGSSVNPLERAQVFRDAINQVKAATHVLIDADLFGAADELARAVMTLEKQWEIFCIGESALVEAAKG